MKILHTSDWHLGKNTAGFSRSYEHNAFIDWLLDKVKELQIDLVVIAGDIFDTKNPSSEARKLYNSFIARLHQQNVPLLVVAGNHDSVNVLDEASDLLTYFDAFVVTKGALTLAEKNLIVFENKAGEGIIICAIPFLRATDLLDTFDYKDSNEKQLVMQKAMRDYYEKLYIQAKQKQREINKEYPIITTGHLTASGVTSYISESVRQVVGTLEEFDFKALPPFDYVALGHIHRSQKIKDNIWYSGSPIPISLDEIAYDKNVLIASFEDELVNVTPIIIPKFRNIISIKGDLETIKNKINLLDKEKETWLVLELDELSTTNAAAEIKEIVKDKNVLILSLKLKYASFVGNSEYTDKSESLDDLTPEEVFTKRLSMVKDEYDEDTIARLHKLYSQVLSEIEDER